MQKAKEAKQNAAAAPASKKDKFVGNSATATVRLIELQMVLDCLFFYTALSQGNAGIGRGLRVAVLCIKIREGQAWKHPPKRLEAVWLPVSASAVNSRCFFFLRMREACRRRAECKNVDGSSAFGGENVVLADRSRNTVSITAVGDDVYWAALGVA